MKRRYAIAALLASALALSTCGDSPAPDGDVACASFLAAAGAGRTTWNLDEGSPEARALLAKYTPLRLTTDLGALSWSECRMLPLLVEAATAMDEVFWLQTWGDREALLAGIEDPGLRTFVQINYGPWDRLDDNRPFLPGIGAKADGANFYPPDMTPAELEEAAAADPALRSLYTMVRRDAEGRLRAVPYHEAFAEPMQRAAAKLKDAAALAEDAGLRRYLEARAAALLSDEYRASDEAWMAMKANRLDVVIGPIETYEDNLLGYKAAAEAYVLAKDLAWSARLSRYAALLPGLQAALPVADAYKAETPGSDSDLNAYDVIFCAGDANTGAKTIALNLPNDEEVQLAKGARRLQLKNVMRAKFDRILVPIADVLIAPDQRQRVTFDAFFDLGMFHEVAHGLGIKNTIDGSGSVRATLKNLASATEEGKADVLGLYIEMTLVEQGELAARIEDSLVTALASIFRSLRFGGADPHAVADMIRFNLFREAGAFTRDPRTGFYRVDFDRMQDAVVALSQRLLVLQGDGDYAGVAELVERYGFIGPELQADLDRVTLAGLPVDVVFEQGIAALP